MANGIGTLVDLGSIKPLTRQNIESFKTDFDNYIINPLFLEKHVGIPISAFYKGRMEIWQVNSWKIINNYL